jgi:NADH-quinone oxidoreductase subunit L
MIELSWLIPALPVLAYAVIVLFTKGSKGLSALLSIAVMGICFALSIGAFLEIAALPAGDQLRSLSLTWISIPPWQANVGILLDPLGVNMLLVVTLVSLLVQVYSWGYMHEDPRVSS